MSLPTAGKMTNLFLYGSENKPSDLLDQSIIDHKNSSIKVKREVDAVEYMDKGPGRFINSANFDFFGEFFDLSKTIAPGSYSKDDIFKLLGYRDPITGDDIAGKYAGYGVNQLFLGVGEEDYAERTYIWATTGFKVSDDAVFVVGTDGNGEVRNFSIEPIDKEDFDFEGGPTSKIGNAALKPVIDPSGIGKTVEFKFTDMDKIPTSTLTKSDFRRDVKSNVTSTESVLKLLFQMSTLGNLTDPGLLLPKSLSSLSHKAIAAVGLYAMEELKNKLFSSGDQPIRFLDSDNRPIIYGTNGGDTIKGTVTTTGVDLNKDEYNIGGRGGSLGKV